MDFSRVDRYISARKFNQCRCFYDCVCTSGISSSLPPLIIWAAATSSARTMPGTSRLNGGRKKLTCRARSSFASHFSWRRGTDPTLGGEVNPGKLAGYCLCLGLETPNQPAPTLPALLATAQPPALVTALAEENLKNRDSDSSGRESAELDLRLSRAGKVP